MKLITNVEGTRQELVIELLDDASGALRYELDGVEREAKVCCVEPQIYSVLVGSRSFEVVIEEADIGWSVTVEGRVFAVNVQDPRRLLRHAASLGAAGAQRITSPMPGKVIKVIAAVGEEVEVGEGLVVIEAMKMQNEIKSARAGKVTRVNVEAGSSVAAGEAMMIIE